MNGKVVPVQDLIDVLRNGRKGRVREALPGEEPDFIQRRDKLSTGIAGVNRHGVSFCFDFVPPMFLQAEVGYIIELLED